MGPQPSIRRFLFTAAILLGVTAVAKLIGAASAAALLGAPDPIIEILSNRHVLLIAAGIEIATIAWIFLASTLTSALAAVLWLGALFGTYRLGLWLLGAGYCPCLGFWLPLRPAIVEGITLAFLVYLISGAAAGLVLTRSSSAAPDSAAAAEPSRQV